MGVVLVGNGIVKGLPDDPDVVLRDFHGEEAGIGHIAVSKVAKFSKYPVHRQNQRGTEVFIVFF